MTKRKRKENTILPFWGYDKSIKNIRKTINIKQMYTRTKYKFFVTSYSKNKNNKMGKEVLLSFVY